MPTTCPAIVASHNALELRAEELYLHTCCGADDWDENTTTWDKLSQVRDIADRTPGLAINLQDTTYEIHAV